MTTFKFNNQTLKAHTIDGKIWFESSVIAKVLGYANRRSITGIYANHKSEFAEDMSQVLESSTSGNYRKKTRVFSLRGVHLIAMLSRTPIAEDFRKWVLDLIEREESRIKQAPADNRRGPYRNRSTDLPPGVYHQQSKYNPYRASAQRAGKYVHVGSFPTSDDAAAAIENFYRTGTVQRLQTSRAIPQINIKPFDLNSPLVVGHKNKNPINTTDLVTHISVFLEAAQLLNCYEFGKDLAGDLIAFAQEECARVKH